MANWTMYAYLLFLFCLTSGAILFFVYKVVYKNRVAIREIANNRKVVKVWPARNYTDKDGSPHWRLFGEKNKVKKLLPVPPPEVIELTNKGKFFAECYRWPDGSISWIKDGNQAIDPPTELLAELDNPSEETIEKIKKNIPAKITKITNEEEKNTKTEEWLAEQIQLMKHQVMQQWKQENHIVESFQPVTTNQRQILINNYAKAAARKTKSTIDKVMQFVPLTGLIIVIVMGMLVWKDLAQPVLDARDQELQSQKIQQESLRIIKDIDNRIQQIEAPSITVKQTVNGNKTIQNAAQS